jgi:hypothetical protein
MRITKCYDTFHTRIVRIQHNLFFKKKKTATSEETMGVLGLK